jgi:hypothetical protein
MRQLRQAETRSRKRLPFPARENRFVLADADALGSLPELFGHDELVGRRHLSHRDDYSLRRLLLDILKSVVAYVRSSVKKLTVAMFRRPATTTAVIFISIPLAFWYCEIRKLPFDRRDWAQSAPAKDGLHRYLPSRRERMLDDLLQKYKFQGMQSNEVVIVLGRPDLDGDDRGKAMGYFLGPTTDFEYRYFSLHLDSTGKVINFIQIDE